MSGFLLIKSSRSQAEFINERTSESWKTPHADAMLARDLEDLIRVGQHLVRLLEAGCKLTQRELLMGRVRDYQEAGAEMEETFRESLGALGALKGRVNRIKKLGYTIDNEADLAVAIDRARQLQDRVLGAWPWVDREMIQRSASDFAGGRFRDLGSFIDELRSPAVADS